MKKNILLSVLLVMATLSNVCAQTSIAKTDLSWIIGSWHIDAGEVQIYETWQEGQGDSYTCEAYVLKGKDTLVIETIKIENIGGFWVYIAQINAQNPVLFTLTQKSTAKELVFENLEHDNPQRVIYKFVNDGELYARTEAVVKGKEIIDEYPYTRR